MKDGRKLSSAHGYGQFLDGTWTNTVNRHEAKYGVEGAGKLTKVQAGALRGDTKLQAAMLAEFTKENVAKGRKMGGSDDDANVYALHNLGDGDAAKLLGALNKNPSTSVSSVLSGNVVSNNKSLYGDGSISVGEAYKRMGSYMRQGDPYAQDARVAAAGHRSVNVAMPNIPTLASSSVPSSVPVSMPKAAEVRDLAVPLNGAGAGRGTINISTPEVVGQTSAIAASRTSRAVALAEARRAGGRPNRRSPVCLPAPRSSPELLECSTDAGPRRPIPEGASSWRRAARTDLPSERTSCKSPSPHGARHRCPSKHWAAGGSLTQE
ncbi:hypothetical protein [Variovorax sp. E3]|uniref:hypothetical protein n=1 Tax=Variovorax sp. E3 TaxID=1914993 RepID=UPI0018DC7992|nr:hypothetical protein [Variovorax sp. E3]